MKMDAETLKALKGSIQKWHDIVYNNGEDLGPSNCPLCQKFIKNRCVGCPVFSNTGVSYCRETPYSVWATWGFPEPPYDDQSKCLALAELKYLQSLLPRDVKP